MKKLAIFALLTCLVSVSQFFAQAETDPYAAETPSATNGAVATPDITDTTTTISENVGNTTEKPEISIDTTQTDIDTSETPTDTSVEEEMSSTETEPTPEPM